MGSGVINQLRLLSNMKKLLLLVFSLWQLAAHAQYQSLLWKISGKGLSEPSYLFGTMHTADPRIVEVGDRALPYFKKCKGYAMELDPGEAFNMNLLGKLMMKEGYSLRKLMPENQYNILDSIIKEQVGYSALLFDNVAPVFVMTLFESASMGLSDSAGAGEVLDLHFYNQAKKERKKVTGIETADEQLSALNALTYEEQAEMLTKEIDNLATDTADGPDLVKFYLNQQLDSVAALDNTNEMPPKFYKALVTDRNIRMADRIDGIVQDKPTFIAIGALHLPAKGGVIELLRKKGYAVEAIKF